ncbi:MAG TPA: class I SAM-dependent rRNA methyltransferase, partial [Myxococcota bacterium]|nr:class I SAM-dependent rRNA methyltransferase [Myxococcota bacterium]
RLIHGEGDLLSGLVCDIYGPAASIKLSNPGLLPLIPILADYVQKELSISDIYLEEEGQTPRALLGEKHEVEFIEQGLHFVAHLKEGQKTGYFLDQRENRRLLQKYANNRRVLDAFCYSGGFSVYALAGGAKEVMSVDLSERAILWCVNNVKRNGPFTGEHKSLSEDCFSFLRTIKPKEFDLIVLDPPAFAKSAQAVERAARGYKDINLCALKALDSQGLLFTFSCSQHISADLFKKIIFAAAKDSGRNVSILHELSQAPDHPVSIYCPQSSYLKGLVLRVD